MDTITHVALGACIGELLATKQLGKKALVIGAVAQNIPDVDIVASFWMNPAADVMAHRGFTHSFLFAVLIAALLAWLVRPWVKPSKEVSFLFWFKFFLIQVFVHVILDAFNAYGTGWFIPFSAHRVSFQTLFVLDLFYTVPLVVALFVLIILQADSTSRNRWAIGGVLVSTLYLGYGVMNKLKINSDVKTTLIEQNIPYQQYFSTPTPLNNWLWFVVASNDDGSFVGYRSVFDKQDKINFEFFPRQDSLLASADNANDVNLLKRFSQGYYTVEQNEDTLIFNDLRFGQMLGWQQPKNGFVFHYYLHPQLDNNLVVQRGRFSQWDSEAIKSFIKRIKGID